MADLYALDFDGVLCDSCGESSLSAVKAAKVRWPSIFNGVDSALEDWIVDQMHICSTGSGNRIRKLIACEATFGDQNPFYSEVFSGYLTKYNHAPFLPFEGVAEDLTVEGMLENWAELKPLVISEWDENKDELIDLFGKVRDEWMDIDMVTWIGANRFYPSVPDALKFASSKLYVVTTKQSRFADALLRELAGVSIPPERIYGLGSG
ncbi:hypothetical protein OROGR_030067 [Orobanche gracilis]